MDEPDEYDVLLHRLGRSERDDQRVCHHEACHAVVARAQNNELGGCSVDPDPEGTYAGLTWGPRYKATLSKDVVSKARDIGDMLRPIMPQPGEDRGAAGDLFQHVHDEIVQCLAGEVGERMFLEGEPEPAFSDRQQAIELAKLVCHSGQAIDALLRFCERQAFDLLYAYSDVVVVLATVLKIRRVLDARAIDNAIGTAIAHRDLATERARRRQWQQRVESATKFKVG